MIPFSTSFPAHNRRIQAISSQFNLGSNCCSVQASSEVMSVCAENLIRIGGVRESAILAA
jgi:hypothetical protein